MSRNIIKFKEENDQFGIAYLKTVVVFVVRGMAPRVFYMPGKWSCSEPHMHPGLNDGGAPLTLRETRIWMSATY